VELRLYCLNYPANIMVAEEICPASVQRKGSLDLLNWGKVTSLLQGHPSASATLRSNSFGHTKLSNTSARVPAGSLV
jgi:hypothetical protein